MSDPRQVLINLVAGLTLADHMGDAWADALEALKQIGIEAPELDDFDAEFGDWMARNHNATTVWGSSLLSEDDDQ